MSENIENGVEFVFNFFYNQFSMCKKNKVKKNYDCEKIAFNIGIAPGR
jgi:hypothetical protein